MNVRKIAAYITLNKTCLKKITTYKSKLNNNHTTQITQNIAQKTVKEKKESIKQVYKKKDALNHEALKFNLQDDNMYGHIFMTEWNTTRINGQKSKIENTHLRHDRKIKHTNQHRNNSLIQILPTHRKSYQHYNHKNEQTFHDKGLKHNLRYNQNNKTLTELVTNTKTNNQKIPSEHQDSKT